MVVKLSSRGPLVTPKDLRDGLMLHPSAELDIKLIDGQLVIRPLKDRRKAKEAASKLYSVFSDADLLTELENEHKQEIARE